MADEAVKPVETPVPATPDTPAPADVKPPEKPAEPAPEQKPGPAAPPKVETVPFAVLEREKRRRKDLELENARLKGMAEGIQKATPPAPPPPPPPPEPELTPDKFDKYEDYTKAVARKEAKEEFEAGRKAEREKEEKELAARKVAEEESNFRSNLEVMVKNAEKEFPDYLEVAGRAELPFDPVLRILTKSQSPNFAKITYYLAQNPDKLIELSNRMQTNPALAAFQLGVLEAKFNNAPPPPKTPKTPEPVAPLTPAPTGEKKAETAAEYISRRNKEDAERRKAGGRRK